MATIAINIGIALAGVVLNAVFAPKPPPQEGPRLNDLALPAVSPGNPINRLYGTSCLGTQLIWKTDLTETRHTEKVKGGKGVGGGKSQESITYTYSCDVAIAVCEGPVNRIRRIWANNKLLYSAVTLVSGVDAQTALAASTMARQMASQATDRMNDTLDNGDKKFIENEKKRIRPLIPTWDANMTTISAAIVLADFDPSELEDDYADLKDFLVNTCHLNSPGKESPNPETWRTKWETWIDALNYVADNLQLAAVGSSNAYVEGQAISETDDAGADLGIDGDTSAMGRLGEAILKSKHPELFNQSGGSVSNNYGRINIYLGTSTQMPDDIIEATEGVGNVPGYRGVCYFVLDDLQLADYGNTLPTFRVEVEQGDGGVTSLNTIITDLCVRGGLELDDFDLSDLTDVPLDGFAVTRVSSGRELLEIIRNVAPFDVTESDFKLKFVDRYRKIRARVRLEDLSAREFSPDGGEDIPPPFKTVRAQVDEFPSEIQFTYQDSTRQFSIGTVRAKRNVVNSELVQQVELPMTLTPTTAKTAVDRLMAYTYTQRRNYTMVLPLKYGILDPGDAILVPDPKGGADRRWRITGSTIGSNNIVEMMLTDHVPPIDIITALAYTPEFENPTVYPTGDTTAFMLDLPALTDTEDISKAGLYVAICGDSPGWPGGGVFVDQGSGGVVPTPGGEIITSGSTSWAAVAYSRLGCFYGGLLTQPIDASPFLWDRTSRILVAINTIGAELVTVTEDTLLRGLDNALVINGEVMQFATATSLGNGVWELRDLLRGRRGTEGFIAAHVTGSDVVFLDPLAVQRWIHGDSLIGIEQDYKAATFGQDIGEVDDFAFTPTGNWMRPLAPCHVTRETDEGTGDITFAWLPRARQGGRWIDGVDVVVDQPFEKYEVDVYDDFTFKRTLTVSDAREVVYDSADAAADFGGAPADGDITLLVYQIGAVVGRGFANPTTL